MPDLLAMYRHAVRARLLDERLRQLGRVGHIGFHPDARGFEPAIVAAVLAMGDTDWIVPSARDHAACLVRGMAIERYVAHVFGSGDDRLGGHPAPGCVAARELRIASPSGLLANHLSHAAGIAWAARLRGEASAVLALFGESAANAGDFHSAANFAGVTRAPLVLLCRTDRRTAAGLPTPTDGVAERAVAYGIESTVCAATDPAAVAVAITEARARAALGGGATLVEAVLEGEADPLDVLRGRLIDRGEWDVWRDFELRRETMAEIEAAVARARAVGPPPREAIFAHVYGEDPPHLQRQRDLMLALAPASAGR
jgi:TPP-dependent pyruvate/acetoin dehydrogenase alpha subunit